MPTLVGKYPNTWYFSGFIVPILHPEPGTFGVYMGIDSRPNFGWVI